MEFLPDMVTKLIEKESQVSTQKASSKAKMLKAIDKRLRVSQKLTEAIVKYSSCETYPASVKAEQFKELYEMLKAEQEKLHTMISDAF